MFYKTIRATACVCALMTAGVLAAPSAAALPQVETSAEFARPMTEAVKLVKARKYDLALKKVNQVAALASTPAEKLSIEQLRTAIFSGLGQTKNLIRSLERQISIGGLPTSTIKAHQKTLAGLYAKDGNHSKAMSLTRAYLKDYGGSPEQFAFVASDALRTGKYAEAISYAEKAIAGAAASGKRAPGAWRKIIMSAQFEAGDLDAYYRTIEKAAAEHPTSDYIRILAQRARQAPNFEQAVHQLDVYRALTNAGVALSPDERADMAERALTRGLGNEAAQIFAPLVKANYAGVEAGKVSRLKRLHARIVEDAARVSTKLKRDIGAEKGADLVTLGEAYSAAGRQSTAVNLLKRALSQGDLKAGDKAYAQLQLGIAQFRAGEETLARKTWAGIKSEDGAERLARIWSAVSRSNVS